MYLKNRCSLFTSLVGSQLNAYGELVEELVVVPTPVSVRPVAQFPAPTAATIRSSLPSEDLTAITPPYVAATTGATPVNSQMKLFAAQPDCSKPRVNVSISNVVCSFSVDCHLYLREIALKGYNVEYRCENSMLIMKLRKPRITASIWSSGKVMCTGANSEKEALIGARRIARVIQKMGFDAKLRQLRIVNVLGVCSLPFQIKINAFSCYFREASYEPELHPGVMYKLVDLKATLIIFSTGSITVTAPTVDNVQQAIERIYPLVFEYRKELSVSANTMRSRKRVMCAAVQSEAAYPVATEATTETLMAKR